MKRSKHSLSHYVLSTFDMGWLVPVCNFEVLPGDSVRMSTSALIRVSPLMAPVMHPVTVRLHHWFVPYRVLWDEWEDFITGGPDGLGSENPIPTGNFAGAAIGSLASYFGLPATSTPQACSLLPFRAYNLIYNEFYRDQDLQAEVAEDDGSVQFVAWEKDYFTAARPWTQKGPEVTLPVGGTAPVNPTGFPEFQTGTPTNVGRLMGNSSLAVSSEFTPGVPGPTPLGWRNPALEADLTQATSSTVNDVRLAFALQRYQEARAQYGSRYTEYLRYLGIRSSDARLQRPEYLGGGRTTINFSEVLRTGNSEAESVEAPPIGDMSGHGISAIRSRRWIRFFEEHGIVLTLASVRPRSMYMDGIHRQWTRAIKEDFWQKELELIGQQEVFNREVYAAHTTPEGVFGYQDRYSEYRHHPSYVTGEFRSTQLDWHLARTFGAPPALNASFVQCQPSKRIHAAQGPEHVLWGMFSHSIQARRLVGRRTIGRIF